MNAKEELIRLIAKTAKIKCASIQYSPWKDSKDIVLKVNYTEEDYNQFLKELDFNYDDGYGGQELFGTVWLEDDTWLSRGEYDGSEWWNHNKSPNIPDECYGIHTIK